MASSVLSEGRQDASAPASPPLAIPARLEVFPRLKAPSTPGNPHDFKVCAVLYDSEGRAVAAEGDFTARGEGVVSGGMYVYPPMYGKLELPERTLDLAVCPAGAQVWPQAMASLAGKSVPLEVTFKGVDGNSVSGSGVQAF